MNNIGKKQWQNISWFKHWCSNGKCLMSCKQGIISYYTLIFTHHKANCMSKCLCRLLSIPSDIAPLLLVVFVPQCVPPRLWVPPSSPFLYLKSRLCSLRWADQVNMIHIALPLSTECCNNLMGWRLERLYISQAGTNSISLLNVTSSLWVVCVRNLIGFGWRWHIIIWYTTLQLCWCNLPHCLKYWCED